MIKLDDATTTKTMTPRHDLTTKDDDSNTATTMDKQNRDDEKRLSMGSTSSSRESLAATPTAATSTDEDREPVSGKSATNPTEDNSDDLAATADDEWSKLRCGSLATEELVRREKEKEARRNRQNRCADYPGFAFGSAMFGSDTTMKFNIIKNELHNIMRSQLKRVDGEVNALSSRIKEFDAKLEESERLIRGATCALAEAVALQIEESKNESEEEENKSNLSAFDQHVLFLEAQLHEARVRASQSFQILEDCDQAQADLLRPKVSATSPSGSISSKGRSPVGQASSSRSALSSFTSPSSGVTPQGRKAVSPVPTSLAAGSSSICPSTTTTTTSPVISSYPSLRPISNLSQSSQLRSPRDSSAARSTTAAAPQSSLSRPPGDEQIENEANNNVTCNNNQNNRITPLSIAEKSQKICTNEDSMNANLALNNLPQDAVTH